MELKTLYFTDAERDNTDDLLKVVKERAGEAGIKKVLIASTTGKTAVRAVDALPGIQVIAVSHSTGIKEQNLQQFLEENRKAFEGKGGTLLTSMHTFAGVSRALRNKNETWSLGEILADTLRIMGDGFKVACEIAMMAADAGLVRTDEDVISVGGSSKGANTALLLTPVNSHLFFDLRVKEILCKPHF